MRTPLEACRVLIAAAVFFGAPNMVAAAELRNIVVDRQDGIYRLESTSWLNVEPEALYAVLANHDLFGKFTSAVVESRNVDPDDRGRPQFFSRFEGCVLLYCKTFVRHGYLELTPHSELIAIVDPEKSDFLRSREKWILIPENGGTQMIYEFEMVPKFWVPPVLGPYYIKRALRIGGEKAVVRIEALARGEEIPVL